MGDGPNEQGASRVHLVKALEDSLRRMQTDYIDLYQIHWPDYDTPHDETLRALDDLVSSGKVRYVGRQQLPRLVADEKFVGERCAQPGAL